MTNVYKMNFEGLLQNKFFYLIVISSCLAIILYFTLKKESAEDVAPLEPETPALETPKIEIPEEAQKEVVTPMETTELSPVAPAIALPAEITAADLLPANDAAQAFEQKFPTGEGEATDKNFLIAGYNLGINTIGSSLKNANLQLRSDPYIPRKDVGIWNQSTILSSDLTNRRTLEIGS
jgi:hypothetical protein